METILLLIIISLLVYISIRVSDIYGLYTNKKLVPFMDDISVIKTREPTDDDDYMSAKEFVVSTGKASISSLQSAFRWGYNKSSRILNELELFGVISGAEQGERYRKVLWQEKQNNKKDGYRK